MRVDIEADTLKKTETIKEVNINHRTMVVINHSQQIYKLVAHDLSEKHCCNKLCSTFLLHKRNDPFLNCIVIWDTIQFAYGNIMFYAEGRGETLTLAGTKTAFKGVYDHGSVVSKLNHQSQLEFWWNRHSR